MCVSVYVRVCAHMPPLSRNQRVLPEVVTSIKSLRPTPNCLSYCLSVQQLASLQDFLLLVSLIISSSCSRSTAQRQEIKLQDNDLPLSLCAEEAKKTFFLLLLHLPATPSGGWHPSASSHLPTSPFPTYAPSNGPNDSDRGLSHAAL